MKFKLLIFFVAVSFSVFSQENTKLPEEDYLILELADFKWQFHKDERRRNLTISDFGHSYNASYTHDKKLNLNIPADKYQEVFTRTTFNPDTYDELKEILIAESDTIRLSKCLDNISISNNHVIKLLDKSGIEQLIMGYRYLLVDEKQHVSQGHKIYSQGNRTFIPTEIQSIKDGDVLIILSLFYKNSQDQSDGILETNLVIKKNRE